MKYFSLHAQNQSNTNVFLTLTLSHRNMTTVSLVASACPHLKAFPPFLTPLSSFSLLPSFPPPRNGRWMGKTCSGGMWGKTTMIPSVIPETENCLQTGKNRQARAFTYWNLSQALPNIRIFKPQWGSFLRVLLLVDLWNCFLLFKSAARTPNWGTSLAKLLGFDK